MMKTKLAFAAAMLVTTASAAFAQSEGRIDPSAPSQMYQREVAAPVGERAKEFQRRDGVPVVGEGRYEGDKEMKIDEADPASSPYAGGGD
jgi:hypothetical protein